MTNETLDEVLRTLCRITNLTVSLWDGEYRWCAAFEPQQNTEMRPKNFCRYLFFAHLPKEDFPGCRPPAGRFHWRLYQRGGRRPGKFSQGEAWRGLPLRKRRPLQGLLQRWEP